MGQWKYWFPGDGGRNESEECARTVEEPEQTPADFLAEQLALIEYEKMAGDDFETLDVMLVSPTGIRTFWTVDLEYEITASAFQNTKLPEE
jgi:hypothetical protein